MKSGSLPLPVNIVLAEKRNNSSAESASRVPRAQPSPWWSGATEGGGAEPWVYGACGDMP
jgi:hypothetical protein